MYDHGKKQPPNPYPRPRQNRQRGIPNPHDINSTVWNGPPTEPYVLASYQHVNTHPEDANYAVTETVIYDPDASGAWIKTDRGAAPRAHWR